MTAAWAPCDSDHYFEEVVPVMPKPWSERAALHHLRFCVNEMNRPKGRPWPSRAELAALWDWSDFKVRALLATDTAWRTHAALVPVDRERLRSPRAPKTNQVTAKSPPSGNQVGTEQRQQSGDFQPSGNQVTAKSPPSRVPPVEPENQKPDLAPAPRRAVRSEPTKAGPLTTAAWDREHERAFGTSYPWLFAGKDHDGTKLKRWRVAAKVLEDDPSPGVLRLAGAFRAYFVAVKAGTAWPPGEATTKGFDQNVAMWLKTDPEHIPKARGRPSETPPDIMFANLAQAAEDIENGRHVQGNHDSTGDPPWGEPPTRPGLRKAGGCAPDVGSLALVFR